MTTGPDATTGASRVWSCKLQLCTHTRTHAGYDGNTHAHMTRDAGAQARGVSCTLRDFTNLPYNSPIAHLLHV